MTSGFKYTNSESKTRQYFVKIMTGSNTYAQHSKRSTRTNETS